MAQNQPAHVTNASEQRDAASGSTRGWPLLAAVLLAGLLFLAWWLRFWLAVALLGALVGVVLDGGARWLGRRLGLRRGAALAVLLILIGVLVSLLGFVSAARIAAEAAALSETLPRATASAIGQLRALPLGEVLLPEGGDGDKAPEGLKDLAQQLTGGSLRWSTLMNPTWAAGSMLLTWVTVSLVVASTGLYLALSPQVYRRLATRLSPAPLRPRVDAAVGEAAQTLRHWFIGQALDMTMLGLITAVGLWLLGVPLPLTLGLLTGLLCFIPNIGPLLSVIPPAILALGGDADNAGWWLAGQVVVLYLLIQTLESYLLTPLIQKRAVEMPPALLIMAQVLGGVTIGLLGVMLAAPTVAVILRLRGHGDPA